MGKEPQETWLESVVQLRDGYESDAVERFTDRLLRFAESRLPGQLHRRVDAEDIVQSVFRSFFARHEQGRFQFREATDVWRLLAAMTYRKVQRTIRFHHQQQRDVREEVTGAEAPGSPPDVAPSASAVVVMMDLLDGILSELPETHQEILRLRLEDYSIDEIAEKVQVSSRTVDRALALVRRIATEMMGQE